MKWWLHHHDKVKATCTGDLWTCDKAAAKAYGINLVQGEHHRGLATDGSINFGSNSGYQALNLVFGKYNAARILLLGYDMGHNGKTHWFGDHPEGIQVNSPFALFIRCFQTINPNDYGIEIINCTPGSKLTHFPMMELEAAL